MSNNLLERVAQYANNHTLYQPGDTIILGLSGGPDSMFLLHALAAQRIPHNLTIIAAHLNHGWRAEAKKDVKFCQEQCKALGVQLATEELSNLLLEKKFNGSKEEYARHARRSFFETVQKKYNAQAIALAHIADDQEETFFIRLLRGSSLAGLVGMKPKNNQYIRPLLQTRKSEILTYLQQHNIPYLHDWTNDTDDYLRNRIRHHVIPALHNADTRFSHNLSRTMAQLNETDNFLERITKEQFNNLKLPDETSRTMLNLTKFRALDPFLQKKILMYWLCQEKVAFTPTQRFFAEIMRFINQPQGGCHKLGTSWHIMKKQQKIWISN